MQLPAHDHLDALGIAYEKREFPVDTEKGAANVAAALGFTEGQMVKTLIFESGDGRIYHPKKNCEGNAVLRRQCQNPTSGS